MQQKVNRIATSFAPEIRFEVLTKADHRAFDIPELLFVPLEKRTHLQKRQIKRAPRNPLFRYQRLTPAQLLRDHPNRFSRSITVLFLHRHEIRFVTPLTY